MIGRTSFDLMISPDYVIRGYSVYIEVAAPGLASAVILMWGDMPPRVEVFEADIGHEVGGAEVFTDPTIASILAAAAAPLAPVGARWVPDDWRFAPTTKAHIQAGIPYGVLVDRLRDVCPGFDAFWEKAVAAAGTRVTQEKLAGGRRLQAAEECQPHIGTNGP